MGELVRLDELRRRRAERRARELRRRRRDATALAVATPPSDALVPAFARCADAERAARYELSEALMNDDERRLLPAPLPARVVAFRARRASGPAAVLRDALAAGHDEALARAVERTRAALDPDHRRELLERAVERVEASR